MARRRDERARVLGPVWIPSKERYRVTVIAPKADGGVGRRNDRWFADADEANDFVEEVGGKLSKFSTTTVEAAITEYQQHLHDSGTGSISYLETCRRLRLFFPSDLAVHRITPERAEAAYAAFRKRLRPDGKPISVDYHRAALINARSFLTWCVARGTLAVNPLTGVKGVGRRSAGKAQLTGDETRKLYAYCLKRAKSGDAAALAILMSLLMALRSADLYRRVVRDVDLDGTVLRVERGKTERSNRPRLIPRVLRTMVRKLVGKRPRDRPLFETPYTESGHHTRRWLEQALEKSCAAAGVPRVVPHALKGVAGTILAETGELADRIADHLSHESTATTKRHYVAPGAIDDARLDRALTVIRGGKKR
jgi:integrase